MTRVITCKTLNW